VYKQIYHLLAPFVFLNQFFEYFCLKMSSKDGQSSFSKNPKSECSSDTDKEANDGGSDRFGEEGDVPPQNIEDASSSDNSLSLIGENGFALCDERTVEDDLIPLEQESPALGEDEIRENFVVLAPQHPLLESFHQSVRNHLSKQNDQLANDIKSIVCKRSIRKVLIEAFKRDAKCSNRRQLSKSPHKKSMLNGFEKTRF
jgi:hypothetical protein